MFGKIKTLSEEVVIVSGWGNREYAVSVVRDVESMGYEIIERDWIINYLACNESVLFNLKVMCEELLKEFGCVDRFRIRVSFDPKECPVNDLKIDLIAFGYLSGGIDANSVSVLRIEDGIKWFYQRDCLRFLDNSNSRIQISLLVNC